MRFDPSDHDLSDAFLDLIDTSGLVGGDDDAGASTSPRFTSACPFRQGQEPPRGQGEASRAARSTGTATR